jgi:hypothetical protein
MPIEDTAIVLPVSASQTRAVLSWDAVTTRRPSGLKAALITSLPCEDVPLFLCRSCGRAFTVGPRAIRNKTYPLPEILEALSLYNRGNTLEATADKISSRYGHQVAPSTISRWLSEHPALTTYRRNRDRGRRLFTPTQVIRTHKLYHRQVYEFAYHRAKLAFLKDGTLDNKRASGKTSTARFSSLADFLESVPHTCPHDLFVREDGVGVRLAWRGNIAAILASRITVRSQYRCCWPITP